MQGYQLAKFKNKFKYFRSFSIFEFLVVDKIIEIRLNFKIFKIFYLFIIDFCFFVIYGWNI
jgi:hypothetical protein